MARLLLALFLVSCCAATAHRRPFRSIKAVRETIENYEQVLPVIAYKDGALPFPTEMRIEVPTQAATYTLSLSMNHMVMPDHFTSVYYDKHGREVIDKTPHANCYYQGVVEGHPDWTAVFSTCHGLQGEFGRMDDPESYFHLEPMDKENPSMEQMHAFYLDSEYKIRDGGCGSGEGHHVRDMVHLARDTLNSTITRRVRRQSSTVRFVEWVLVNDNRQYVANGNDLSATVMRALSITNGVDNIFRVLGIRLTLTRSITFTTSDLFTVQPDPEPLLNAFTSYVRSSLTAVPYDSIMLITGIDITSSTVGIAFIGTMCQRRTTTGLSQDGGRSLTSLATTAAHELGHIFNMNHDDGRSCTCGGQNNQCVMSAVSGFPPPSIWSSCSVDDLNVLISEGGDSCLFNTPTEMVGTPVCGNGIREGIELCDCGSPAECTDDCCDAATCQFVSGAVCSAGACCSSQCQFQAYGTQCRGASNECDVAEYCLGDLGECPQDDHRVDGVACGSNTGYCNDGMCPSHQTQCTAAWGTGTGPTACYNFNTYGGVGGNCGHIIDSRYLACTSGNVMCGQLQCREGTYTNVYGPSGVLFTLTTGSGRCNSFGVSLDLDGMNPGLVEEGTKCGDGMVCELQQCVSLSSQTFPTCPSANGQQCSGPTRGVCNNRGVCSCDVGFTGNTCQSVVTAGVNECLTNNGGCAQVCADTAFFFQCSCNSGFNLNSDGRTCVDINECSLNTDNCDQTCTNNQGSFTCSCVSGFTASNGGRTCADINECALNTDNCNQTCTNDQGSFTCCNRGFTLSGDGRTCLVMTSSGGNGNSTASAGGVPIGALAGGIVGALIMVLVLVAVIVVIIVFARKRKGDLTKVASPTPYNTYMSPARKSYPHATADGSKMQKNRSGSAEDLLDGRARVTTAFTDSFASDDSFEDDPTPYTPYNGGLYSAMTTAGPGRPAPYSQKLTVPTPKPPPSRSHLRNVAPPPNKPPQTKPSSSNPQAAFKPAPAKPTPTRPTHAPAPFARPTPPKPTPTPPSKPVPTNKPPPTPRNKPTPSEPTKPAVPATASRPPPATPRGGQPPPKPTPVPLPKPKPPIAVAKKPIAPPRKP